MKAFSELVATARARTGELGRGLAEGGHEDLHGRAGRADRPGLAAEGPRAGPEWLARPCRRVVPTVASARPRRRGRRARRPPAHGRAAVPGAGRRPTCCCSSAIRSSRTSSMGFQHYTTRRSSRGVAPWVGLDNYSDGHPLGRVQQGGGQHAAVHRRVDRRAVRDRAGPRAVLPAPVPAERRAALAAAAAVADPADRLQRRLALDPRPGQRRAQPRARQPASGRRTTRAG